MDRASIERLATWIAREESRALDPAAIDALRAALDAEDPPATAGRGGTSIGYVPGPARRRLAQFDRRGHLVAACRWREDGALAWAKCRTAHGEWIGIEPGPTASSAWGRSDWLWRLDPAEAWAPVERITEFQALDYQRLDFIPPLLEPARLPPGAGTAVLDLIAGLMKDQGASRVRYRGPYPTEQLFTALLESFRYADAGDDPLGRFMDGGALDWVPAPHERHHVADGVWVQMRHEIEKVALDGAAFYRRDWQGVIRREPRVVRAEGDRVVCSLWALGQSIEDRLVLDRDGEVLARPAARPSPGAPAPMPPVWAPALAEIIARESAPALGEPLRLAVRELALEWGAVPGDLVRVDGATARVSRLLRDTGLAWVREALPEERGTRAIAFALEVARLLAPAARTRAQSCLAAWSPEAQERALAAEPMAEALPESVGRLLALLARGGA